MKKLRGWFNFEWAWRLFVVSQIFGLLVIVYLDLTTSGTSGSGGIFGSTYSWRWDFFMDFFNYTLWDDRGIYTKNNKISFVCIFGPFLVWKSADWIASSANDDKQQPPE